MAYAFFRSVRLRLLRAFLLAAGIPLLLLSTLFYEGYREEMQPVLTTTKQQALGSLTEREKESVASSCKLSEPKLLSWRERREGIASLSRNFSINVHSVAHFSRFSYLAPLLASAYERADVQSAWVAGKNHAYAVCPGKNPGALAKEGKLNVEIMLCPNPSSAITNFSPENSLFKYRPAYKVVQRQALLRAYGHKTKKEAQPVDELTSLPSHILGAHGFVMPNPSRVRHFELPNMDQL